MVTENSVLSSDFLNLFKVNELLIKFRKFLLSSYGRGRSCYDLDNKAILESKQSFFLF